MRGEAARSGQGDPLPRGASGVRLRARRGPDARELPGRAPRGRERSHPPRARLVPRARGGRAAGRGRVGLARPRARARPLGSASGEGASDAAFARIRDRLQCELEIRARGRVLATIPIARAAGSASGADVSFEGAFLAPAEAEPITVTVSAKIVEGGHAFASQHSVAVNVKGGSGGPVAPVVEKPRPPEIGAPFGLNLAGFAGEELATSFTVDGDARSAVVCELQASPGFTLAPARLELAPGGHGSVELRAAGETRSGGTVAIVARATTGVEPSRREIAVRLERGALAVTTLNLGSVAPGETPRVPSRRRAAPSRRRLSWGPAERASPLTWSGSKLVAKTSADTAPGHYAGRVEARCGGSTRAVGVTLVVASPTPSPPQPRRELGLDERGSDLPAAGAVFELEPLVFDGAGAKIDPDLDVRTVDKGGGQLRELQDLRPGDGPGGPLHRRLQGDVRHPGARAPGAVPRLVPVEPDPRTLPALWSSSSPSAAPPRPRASSPGPSPSSSTARPAFASPIPGATGEPPSRSRSRSGRGRPTGSASSPRASTSRSRARRAASTASRPRSGRSRTSPSSRAASISFPRSPEPASAPVPTGRSSSTRRTRSTSSTPRATCRTTLNRARTKDPTPDRKVVNEAARAIFLEGLGPGAHVVSLRVPLPAAARSVPFLEKLGSTVVELDPANILETARKLAASLGPPRSPSPGRSSSRAARPRSPRVPGRASRSSPRRSSRSACPARSRSTRSAVSGSSTPTSRSTSRARPGTSVAALVAPRATIPLEASAFRLASKNVHVHVVPKDKNAALIVSKRRRRRRRPREEHRRLALGRVPGAGRRDRGARRGRSRRGLARGRGRRSDRERARDARPRGGAVAGFTGAPLALTGRGDLPPGLARPPSR